MSQATIDYLKSRMVSITPKISGNIATHSDVTFDNGIVVEGCSIRDINNYDKIEAENAAFLDAISTLAPGVDLVLSKKI